VAQLAQHYGFGPKLRRHQEQLSPGGLIDVFACERLEQDAARDQQARTEQERLRVGYLAWCEREARRRKHDIPLHEQQLAGTRADIQNLERKIYRYLQAFEDAKLDPDICQQRIERHHTRLQALRDQEADLAQTLVTHADTQPDTASLAAIADQLDQLIATANPEQAKELLRLLIKDIRVHDQHKIIPTYRVPPAVRTMHGTVGETALCANRALMAAPAVRIG
jgi:hypothetical protein